MKLSKRTGRNEQRRNRRRRKTNRKITSSVTLNILNTSGKTGNSRKDHLSAALNLIELNHCVIIIYECENIVYIKV